MKSSQIKLSTVLTTIGVAYGLFYSVKHNKSLAMTSLFVLGFGLAGVLIGSKIEKVKS